MAAHLDEHYQDVELNILNTICPAYQAQTLWLITGYFNSLIQFENRDRHMPATCDDLRIITGMKMANTVLTGKYHIILEIKYLQANPGDRAV